VSEFSSNISKLLKFGMIWCYLNLYSLKSFNLSKNSVLEQNLSKIKIFKLFKSKFTLNLFIYLVRRKMHLFLYY